MGAGTSGRLGVLDSVELNPTFSWPRERAVGLLAGGQEALLPTARDVVILLAASGATPYAMGALAEARAGGALSLAIANNPGALMVRLHKGCGNLMVDVRATNAKLIKRALRLTMLASGAAEPEARAALGACGWRVKVALVMLKGGLKVHEAEDRLDAAEGSVHAALALPGA